MFILKRFVHMDTPHYDWVDHRYKLHWKSSVRKVTHMNSIYYYVVCVCVCVTEGRHANAKAHEAIDHMASFRHVQRSFHN